VQAGVPAYIDYVVDSNEERRKLYREGIAWLHHQPDELAALTRYIDQPGDELPACFFWPSKA
jgi:hypothetical protein